MIPIPMIRLNLALRAWGTPNFSDTLKQEVEALDIDLLPLQQALTQGSYALSDSARVMIIDTSEAPGRIRVKVGVFYAGMIPGCSCADDPTPIDETTEYCELCFEIDKVTAETVVILVDG